MKSLDPHNLGVQQGHCLQDWLNLALTVCPLCVVCQCWPDPKQMVAELHDAGVEVMLSPYFHSVTANSKYFEQARAGNLLARGLDGTPSHQFYDNA